MPPTAKKSSVPSDARCCTVSTAPEMLRINRASDLTARFEIARDTASDRIRIGVRSARHENLIGALSALCEQSVGHVYQLGGDGGKRAAERAGLCAHYAADREDLLAAVPADADFAAGNIDAPVQAFREFIPHDRDRSTGFDLRLRGERTGEQLDLHDLTEIFICTEQHHAGCAVSGADRAADRTDGACGFDAGDGLRHPLREGRGERRAGAALVCAHRKAAHADACKTVFDLRAAEQTERSDDEQRTCADRDRER